MLLKTRHGLRVPPPHFGFFGRSLPPSLSQKTRRSGVVWTTYHDVDDRMMYGR